MSATEATMLGYVAGLADNGNTNPYKWDDEQSWHWQHGFTQGFNHRVRSKVDEAMRDIESRSKPEVIKLPKWMFDRGLIRPVPYMDIYEQPPYLT